MHICAHESIITSKTVNAPLIPEVCSCLLVIHTPSLPYTLHGPKELFITADYFAFCRVLYELNHTIYTLLGI